MKLKLLFAILLACLPALGAIDGTITVPATLAPPATNSNFGVVEDKYIIGGLRVSFENVGDWMDPNILPTGLMRTNMVVRARTDSNHRSYRLISVSPRVFEADTDVVLKAQVDALAATVAGLGSGSSGSNSFIVVANVAAMIVLPHARLTNGTVVIHTMSRNSGGIGGSDFSFDYNSVQTVNLGTIFAHSSGTGRFYNIGNEPGDIDLYGADSVGTTDSAAAITSAMTYATSIHRRTYIPGRTYYSSILTVPTGAEIDWNPDAVLRLFAYPTYPGGNTSAQPDLTKGFITLTSDTIMRPNGATLDCRYGDFTATSYNFAAVKIKDARNVTVGKLRVLNSWRHNYFVNYSTNVDLIEPLIEGGPSSGMVQHSDTVRIRNGMSLNQVFDSPVSDQSQHVWDNYQSRHVSIDGFIIRNALGSSAGPSYAISGFTIGGDFGDVYTHMSFEPLNSATDINGAAMLLDGCMNTVFSDSDVTGWNIGQATPVELSSPRNVTLRSLRINGQKDYTTDRDTGGAGIFIVDNGIFSEDNPPSKWNSLWQWRSRSAGSGVLIDDCDISRCYNGILFSSSYSTIRNCRITGNINAGVVVGRVGTSGTSSFGWVNPTAHRSVGNRILDSDISWNGGDGIQLDKFEDLYITGNTISRNNQGGGGYAGLKSIGDSDQGTVHLRDNIIGDPATLTMTDGFSIDPSQPQYVVRSARVTGSGNSTTVVNVSTTMTTDQYKRLYLRLQSTGSTARILSNTTTAITLETALSTTPGTGVLFDIIEVPIYRISVTKQEEIIQGQRILLSGVQTGGVDMPVIVSHTDWAHPDEFLANPVGTSSQFGTFSLVGWNTTAGGAIVAGTGTMSFTYQGASFYSPQAALKVTMSVNAANELDNPYYIGVDPGTGTVEWRRVQRSLGWGGVLTELYIDRPFSQSFTGRSFLISKITGSFNQGQSWGIDFGGFAGLPAFSGKLDMVGTGNFISGNLNAAQIRGTGALDFPYTRLPDSATPTKPLQGDKFQFGLTTPRTITSIGGGREGSQMTLFYLAGSAPTLTGSGANMVSSDGANHTLTVGSVVNMTYSNGKWLWTFVIP